MLRGIHKILVLPILVVSFNSYASDIKQSLKYSKDSVRKSTPRDFCQKINNVMSNIAEQQGVDRRESSRLGNKATSLIFSQLKNGKLNPYLDVTSLESAAASSTPTIQHQWLSLPEIILSSMGSAPKNVLFIDQINDLRFSPQMAPGSQLLVLVSDMGDLSQERASKVAQSAQALGVSINIIWVNSTQASVKSKSSQTLAMLTAATNGVFLDLSHQSTCSGS